VTTWLYLQAFPDFRFCILHTPLNIRITHIDPLHLQSSQDRSNAFNHHDRDLHGIWVSALLHSSQTSQRIRHANISSHHSYVLLSAFASQLVLIWHSSRTSKARKAAGVPYPNPYASQEAAEKDPLKYRFNTTQRAHGNALENYPAFLLSLFVVGAVYPKTAATLGLGWSASRVLYAVGYSDASKGPNGRGRMNGAIGQGITLYVLQLAVGWVGLKTVLGW
jgi:glutathione S-transferase